MILSVQSRASSRLSKLDGGGFRRMSFRSLSVDARLRDTDVPRGTHCHSSQSDKNKRGSRPYSPKLLVAGLRSRNHQCSPWNISFILATSEVVPRGTLALPSARTFILWNR